MPEDWQNKIEEYSNKYNIPLSYLAETLYEPKVVPMIRGKAFEFSVMLALKNILPSEIWLVEKEAMNAQAGFHDVDVRVVHKPTNQLIRIECKLAGKGSYRLHNDGHSEIRVKCMRSRTLGAAMVADLAPKLGLDEDVLTVHNDQYLPTDFDVVITSIGNAFYETDSETGLFEWKPTVNGRVFLESIKNGNEESLKDFAFNSLYVAKATDISINPNNDVNCTRRKCTNKTSCGFIPNYPVIKFNNETLEPDNNWVHIQQSLTLFESFLNH